MKGAEALCRIVVKRIRKVYSWPAAGIVFLEGILGVKQRKWVIASAPSAPGTTLTPCVSSAGNAPSAGGGKFLTALGILGNLSHITQPPGRTVVHADHPPTHIFPPCHRAEHCVRFGLSPHVRLCGGIFVG